MSEQRREAAVMFTDMVGYSKKVAADEARALALVDEHNALLTSAIEKRGGRVLRFIGDAVMAEFSSPVAGVESALDIQRTLRERNHGKDEFDAIRVRIGIHHGNILFRGNDIFGHGVNIAARLEPLAKPGGICVSRAVYDLVKKDLRLNAVSLGLKDLKNVGEPVEVFHVLLDEADAALHASETITRFDDPRMRVAVVPFWGSTPEENDEGRKMAALIVRSLEKEMEGGDMQIAFEDKAEVKTNGEALALGAARRADSVIWGEVVSLYGEVEIQPRLTWVHFRQFSPARVGALATSVSEKGAIALRRAKADEVAHAALYMGALHHRALGNLDEAVLLFKKYIAKMIDSGGARDNTDVPATYGRLCWCYWLQHKIADALETAREGAQRFPQDAGLRAHLAACLMRVGKTEEGLREIEEALRLDPKGSVTRARVAFTYSHVNRHDDAIACGVEGVQQDPRSAYARYHLGSAYFAAGRIGDAIREYSEAARLEPENHEHRRWLGVAYLAHAMAGGGDDGAIHKAGKCFSEARRLAPFDRYNQLLVCAMRLFRGAAEFDSASVFPVSPSPEITERWPTPVFHFFEGGFDEDALFAMARAADDETVRIARETEACFYAALKRFAADDREGMLAFLKRCVPQNMFEDVAARGAVKAIAEKAP